MKLNLDKKTDTPAKKIIPFQAPIERRPFVGRKLLYEKMLQAITYGKRIILTGERNRVGIGRTALATHFAHQLKEAFPDGVIWIPHSAFDPYLVARHIANALGVNLESQINSSNPEKALDILLAGKNMLVVLDDVQNDKVFSIIPPIGPSVIAIAISEGQIQNSETEVIHLDNFAELEADLFIQNIVGMDSFKKNQEFFSELLNLCSFHPLSIRLAISAFANGEDNSLRHKKTSEIERFMKTIRQRFQRLQKFNDETQWIGATFSYSVDVLPLEEKSFLSAISILPQTGFTTEASASVSQISLDKSKKWLERFVKLGLLDETSKGIFYFPPLIRALSQGIASELNDATTKASVYYSKLARKIKDDYTSLDCNIENIFEAINIMMEKGDSVKVKETLDCLCPYLDERAFKEEVQKRIQLGIASSYSTNDKEKEGRFRYWLARYYKRQEQIELAREQFLTSISLAIDSNDSTGKLKSLLDLAYLEREFRSFESSVDYFEQALSTIITNNLDREGEILFEFAQALFLAGHTAEAHEKVLSVISFAEKNDDIELLSKAKDLRDKIPPQLISEKPANSSSNLVNAKSLNELLLDLKSSDEILSSQSNFKTAFAEDIENGSKIDIPTSIRELMSFPTKETIDFELVEKLVKSTGSPEKASPHIDAMENTANEHIDRGNYTAGYAQLLMAATLAKRLGLLDRASLLFEKLAEGRIAQKDFQNAISDLDHIYRIKSAISDNASAQKTLIRISNLATQINDYDCALYYLLRALEFPEKTSKDSLHHSDILLLIGDVYAFKGEFDQAHAHYELAEEHLMDYPKMDTLSRLHLCKGSTYIKQLNFTRAKEHLLESIEKARIAQDFSTNNRALWLLGDIYMESQDYKQSKQSYRKSLEGYHQQSDVDSIMKILQSLALVESLDGNYDEASRHYHRVIALSEACNQVELTAKIWRVLGDLEADRSSFDFALEAYQEALNAQLILGDKKEIASIYLGFGSVRSEQGRVEEAIRYLNNSLEMSKMLNDAPSVANTLYQLGAALAEAHREQQAMLKLKESLVVDESIGNQRGMALTLALLGQILSVNGQPQEAKKMFEQSRYYMRQLNMPEQDMLNKWLLGE